MLSLNLLTYDTRCNWSDLEVLSSIYQQQYNILIIDSGVGGLSILNEIHMQLPMLHTYYVADHAQYPYGEKPQQLLIERLNSIVKHMISLFHIDLIVIACNTASTVVLPHLRAHYTMPVVGVVPAIKPAAALSHSKVIGLLATPGTVSREYTQQLIENFASDCTVIKVGSKVLVDYAERHLSGEHIALSAYREVLSPFWKQQHAEHIDTIVLGCTHFPLVTAQLRKASPFKIQWVDSSAAVARQVSQQLVVSKDTATQDVTHHFFHTGNQELSQALIMYLKNMGFTSITHIDID